MFISFMASLLWISTVDRHTKPLSPPHSAYRPRSRVKIRVPFEGVVALRSEDGHRERNACVPTVHALQAYVLVCTSSCDFEPCVYTGLHRTRTLMTQYTPSSTQSKLPRDGKNHYCLKKTTLRNVYQSTERKTYFCTFFFGWSLYSSPSKSS